MPNFSNVSFELLFIIFISIIFVVVIFNLFVVIYIRKHPYSFELSKRNLKSKSFFIFASVNTLLLFGVIFLIYQMFFTYPHITSTYPLEGEYWRNYDNPIEINFSRPINTKGIVINLLPNTSGEWKFEKKNELIPFVDSIKFYPNETVYPGNEIYVYMSNISNVFSTIKNYEAQLKFYSTDLPTINDSQPQSSAEFVQVGNEVSFNLSHKDGEYVEWAFLTNVNDHFEIIRDKSTTIKLKFDNNFSQGKEYFIKVYRIPVSQSTKTGDATRSGDKQNIYNLHFKTVGAPLITNASPKGSGILTNASVKISFDYPMDKESVEKGFQISPNVAGSFYWSDDLKTMRFTPSSTLEKDKSYTVKIASGVHNQNGGVSEEEIVFSFQTIGRVKVSSWNPRTNATSIATGSNINVTFNQSVDQQSAQSKFSISPNIPGAFSWSGNTMVFNPDNNLDFLTNYQITISADIKSINGLDSNESFTSSFTTEAKKVLLSVPQYRQVNSKECQIVATQIIMGYKGKAKDKTTIFNEFPKETTVCDAENNIWGNPNIGFVGDINGNHDCASGNRGYGVYWSPVSSYLSRNGISNSVSRGMSITQLTQEIEAGHPVMLWWQNGWSTPTDVSWDTPDGQHIYAVNGMHSEVAIGFIGTTNNPTHIIVQDPWRGQRTLEIGYFKGLWSYFGNTGIIVY